MSWATVTVAGLMVVLSACTAVVPMAALTSAAAPAPEHGYRLAQERRGTGLTFSACNDCPAPTPKTLPAPRLVVADAAVALPPAPAKSAPSRTVTQHALIRFDLGSARLRPEAAQQLAGLVPLLKLAERVQITGYTDDLGNAAINERLSRERAQAIAGHLRQLLSVRADNTGLLISGQALCCYVAANRSESGRAMNRRADLAMEVPDAPAVNQLVRSAGPLPPLAAKTAATATRTTTTATQTTGQPTRPDSPAGVSFLQQRSAQ
jgi:outer membrane protein OmpA-like peptidoglycan-associated protein